MSERNEEYSELSTEVDILKMEKAELLDKRQTDTETVSSNDARTDELVLRVAELEAKNLSLAASSDLATEIDILKMEKAELLDKQRAFAETAARSDVRTEELVARVAELEADNLSLAADVGNFQDNSELVDQMKSRITELEGENSQLCASQSTKQETLGIRRAELEVEKEEYKAKQVCYCYGTFE